MLIAQDFKELLLKDHKLYLAYIADICALSIPDNIWVRVRQNLSPLLKTKTFQPIEFYSLIEPQFNIEIDKEIEFTTHCKLYLIYDIGLETSGVNEFFLSGGKYFREANSEIKGVKHVIRATDNPHRHIYGVVTIQKTQNTDNTM